MAFKSARALILGFFIQTGFAQTAPSVLPPQPAWHQLSAAQRAVLAPLSQDWKSFSDERKIKWLGIANRYASMTPVEQARLQQRMKEWAALSPLEREKARTQYKRLRTVPGDERKALEQRWQAYDALPGDEKQRLKEAKPAPRPATSAPAISATAPRRLPPKAVAIAPPSGKPKLAER